MQKVLKLNQLSEYTQYLDVKMIEYIGGQPIESFEGFANFDLLAFDWYDVQTDETAVSRILIYVDREDLFFLCEDQRSVERCMALLAEGQSNERAMYLFFVGLLRHDTERLDAFEADVTDAEDEALHSTRGDYLAKIHEYHKELLRMKRYYEQLNSIMDNLVANDNGLLSEEGVRRLSIVHNRVERFCAGVSSLRDYVTQMREACQAQIDLEQNNLMRVFTVLTAVFLPLTLIVGWYGMNFQGMPELSWRYGYPAVIVLSAAVSMGMLAWFKHKRWF